MKYVSFGAVLLVSFLVAGGMPHTTLAANNTLAEKAVKIFFKDIPEMIAIAECESTFRQYDAGGFTLNGGYHGKMIGLFQINEVFHRDQALAMGFDIDTILGNIGYAKWLYQVEGTVPWVSSAHCWVSKVGQYTVATVHAAEVEGEAEEQVKEEEVEEPDEEERNTEDDERKEDEEENVDDEREERDDEALNQSEDWSGKKEHTEKQRRVEVRLTRYLSYTYVDEEVRLLQRLLNSAGYTIASSGPGSPGNETNIFGPLTVRALTRFQCGEDVVCPSNGTTAGYGVVDEKTREALNEYVRDL